MRPKFFLPVTVLISAVLLGAVGFAQSTSRGINPDNMCKTCNACEDFYLYANGGWLVKNEIPAAFSTWGDHQQLARKTSRRVAANSC